MDWDGFIQEARLKAIKRSELRERRRKFSREHKRKYTAGLGVFEADSEKKDLAWTCNQLGYIRFSQHKFRKKRVTHNKLDKFREEYLAGIAWAGKQESRYHLYDYRSQYCCESLYQGAHADPMKYMGGYAGLRMYDQLNFSDEPVWERNM